MPTNGKKNGGQGRGRKRGRGGNGRSGNGGGNNRNGNGGQQMSTIALTGIVPAVGATPPRPFKKTTRGKMDLRCWDALHPMHLSLPRAVGEYSVFRSTLAFSSNDPLIIFSPFMHYSTGADASVPVWTNQVAIGAKTLGSIPYNANEWNHYMTSQLYDSATYVPAAITVQIMNGNALQSTYGVAYIGRVKTAIKYSNNPIHSAGDIAHDFVQYFSPRLCSLPKLALRGVKVDSYPLNMGALSDFTSIWKESPNSTEAWVGKDPAGFAPILFHNTAESPEHVDFLVTVEWRTRFSMQNPASASHEHHPISSDQIWDRLMKAATNVGHGCIDIAESVAMTGLAGLSRGAIAM